MIDYGTVDDILSTTQNMTVLRNNSLQDDGTDTVEGVEWFRYKGEVASTLYVSGNSWIGFGENAEHLKIVRRDTDLMTLRREEGTLWGTPLLAYPLGGIFCTWKPERCYTHDMGCNSF
jgi:hypothetical protein